MINRFFKSIYTVPHGNRICPDYPMRYDRFVLIECVIIPFKQSELRQQ